MIIKRGKVEIVEVIGDTDHKLDDEGTRKAMEKAAQTVEQEKKEADKDLRN